MLRVSQLRTATVAVLSKWRAGMRRWWLAMSDTEQRETMTRASLVAVCAVAATVTLPAIGLIQSQKRAESDYRADVQRLAQMLDGGAAVRAGADAPQVLDVVDGAMLASDRIEIADDIERLRRCLDGLDPGRAELVRLAYLEGWSREQLATKAGHPVATIKTWLHRSLKQLKTCLTS